MALNDDALIEAVTEIILRPDLGFDDAVRELAGRWPMLRISDLIGVCLKSCELLTRSLAKSEQQPALDRGREFALYLSNAAFDVYSGGRDPALVKDILRD